MTEETIFEDWELDPKYQAAQICELTAIVRDLINLSPEAAAFIVGGLSAERLQSAEAEARSRQNAVVDIQRNAIHNIHHDLFETLNERLAQDRDGDGHKPFAPAPVESSLKRHIDLFIKTGDFSQRPQD